MTSRRARLVAYLLCLGSAFLVWNGVFGLLVSRGEKQYLLDQARHEAGLGPEASLPYRMDTTIRGGVAGEPPPGRRARGHCRRRDLRGRLGKHVASDRDPSVAAPAGQVTHGLAATTDH